MLAPSQARRLTRRQRNQRYLARLRSGQTVVRVTVDERIIGFLIRSEWLLDREAGDNAKIADAIERLLAEACEGG